MICLSYINVDKLSSIILSVNNDIAMTVAGLPSVFFTNSKMTLTNLATLPCNESLRTSLLNSLCILIALS